MHSASGRNRTGRTDGGRVDLLVDQIIHRLDTLAEMFQDKHPGLPSTKEATGQLQHADPKQDQATPHLPYSEVGQIEQPEPLPPEPRQTASQPPAKTTQKNWQGFLEKIQQTLPFMVALLSKGRVTESSDQVRVELDKCSGFDKQRLDSKMGELVHACREHLGKKLDITILSQNDVLKTQDKKKTEMKTMQAAFNHPLVVEAQKKFDGKIINY